MPAAMVISIAILVVPAVIRLDCDLHDNIDKKE
jgi:hypothetical protein